MSLTTSQLLPLLEPLSDATKTALEPLPLYHGEVLTVHLNDDGDKFVCQAAVLIKTPYGNTPQFTKDGVGYSFSVGQYGLSKAAQNWYAKVPERQIGNHGQVRIAVTDFSAIVMLHSWGQDRIIFETDEAELAFTFLIKRFDRQTRSARVVADFKIGKVVPGLPPEFVDHPDFPLAPFQKVGLSCSLYQKGYALFMEQGTGKTPTVIARVCTESRKKFNAEKKMYRVLVIGPKNVRMNWEREFMKFATNPGKTVVVRGGLNGRIKSIIEAVREEADCQWSACIMSVDSVDSTYEALRRVPWDLVVLDESHYVKNPNSVRFKGCMKLQDLKCNPSFTCLTGTPIANSIFDLWSQLELLGRGLSGFSNYSAYRKFHSIFKNHSHGGTSIQKLVGFKGIPMIQERLARLSFMLRKSEASLYLPDKVYDIEEVYMTPNQAKMYNELSAKLVVEIEEALSEAEASGKKSITVEHILTMLLRLAQITSGHIRWDSDEGAGKGLVEQIAGGNPKVDAVMEMLKSEQRDPLGKTIIWCHFVEDMRVISERLAKEGINHVGYHAAIHEDYRKGSAEDAAQHYNCSKTCRVLIANPASGGTGLNVVGYDPANPDDSDFYTDHVIYVSCDWSATKRSQSEDRAHRRGTRNNVRITDLIVPGTIDEEIRARVMQKQKTALLVQDIRELLTTIRTTKYESD